MSPKEKSGRPTKLPLHRKPAPLTIERLVPLFEDMKDFVRATVRGSETMLREELTRKIDAVRTELTQLGGKIDAIQCALTEHTKCIKTLTTNVRDHEGRLTHLEQHVS